MADGLAALVTGASGFIGSRLVARLVDSGYRVIAPTRRPEHPMAAGVCVTIADLASGHGVTPWLADGVDVVFHCAGQITEPLKMHELHVNGTGRLIDAVARRPSATRPIHWVQLSSVGAYGPPATPSQSRRIDEKSPERPVGIYERTKTEADRLVTRAAAEGKFSCSILRPANVVGVGMRSASVRGMISIVERGWFIYVGRAGAMTNYVHVDDVVDALVACATHPDARAQTFNLSSDCTLEQVVERIAAARGVRRPRFRIPESIVRGSVRVVGTVCRHPLTPARIDALVNRTLYPTTKIETRLGYRLSRPMPLGLDDLLEVSHR